MQIIAHRGMSKKAHENTLNSFREAIKYYPDMIEFDVRRSADGILMVHHDKKINGIMFERMTKQQIDIHYKGLGIEIPTFEQALIFGRDNGINLDIEIKEMGYEEKVLEQVSALLESNQFVLKSFHDESVLFFKEKRPDYTVGLLLKSLKTKMQPSRTNQEFYFEKRVEMCRADFISPHYTLIKGSFLKRAQKENLPVFVWTVNERQMMESFWNLKGITALVTDQCDVAREIKDGEPKQY